MLVIGLVYAVGNYVWSDPISVTVYEATVSLDRMPSGDVILYSNVTFYGQVLKDESGVDSSNVTLFKDSTLIAWTSTNLTGHYEITWNATETGTLNFTARAEI